MTLKDLLPPCSTETHPVGCLPTAATNRDNVKEALAYPEPPEEWLIADEHSREWREHPKPSAISPAVTAAKGKGHWLGSRHRRLTLSETSRLHGFLSSELLFPHDVAEGDRFSFLCNTMPLPIVAQKRTTEHRPNTNHPSTRSPVSGTI